MSSELQEVQDRRIEPLPSTESYAHRAIRGIIPTVLTPFDENEQVDDVALRAQIQYLIDADVHGLVVMGSLGECPYLNDDDREIMIRTCADTVGAAGRALPIIVGIAAPSTFVAVEQMRQARRLGAQAGPPKARACSACTCS